MAKIVIAADNKADAGTYSGGTWVSALPLNNLKDYHPKLVARSDGDSNAATQFVVDLGSATDIDVVALINHNLSAAATARVRIGPNANGSSALIDVTLTASNFGSDHVPAAGRTMFYVTPETVSARYVLWEIDDTSNVKGYGQIGRHWAGPALRPEVNVVYGVAVTPIDNSRVTTAYRGDEYVDRVPLLRNISGAFDMLTEDEAFGTVYDMQAVAGITEPVLVILDSDLSADRLSRTVVYGIFTSLSPITVVHETDDDTLSTWQFAVEEVA